MANNIISEKKKALVGKKEKLLQDIRYYEKRIADFHVNKSATSFYEDNCSSDSDGDLPIIDNGPSVTQLKLQQSRLKTSLQATQELTSLHLLEHEVNIMVQDPIIENERPVQEPGVWKEVIAECRMDLVPFSITFHVHRPSVKFGAPSYRNLKVILSKPAHETELANSVLAHVTTPSDAVEVLRSYSAAHRSRRTTLARLAEKYPNLLFMEPLAEGGYILKCAGLLEVCWTLQNKWSPIAPFHHRMRFDLEYMDESYIKIITQYHRQLSDPSLETDERTALLSKIINTCLEAKGPTQELYESMESDDPETAQTLRKRRTTLDQEVTEMPPKRKRDDAIMAPPKSLPKKSKPKGKENKVQNNDISKVTDRDVTDASGRECVVSASKDSRKDDKSSKESSNRKENTKLAMEASERNVIAKSGKEISDNRKESAKSAKEVINSRKETAKPSKAKDNKSAKEKDGKKDTLVKSKDNAADKSDNARAKEVSNSGKESAKSIKETGNKKDGLSKPAKEKDGKKDNVVKSKENSTVNEFEVRNSVAKSTKDNEGGKTQRKTKDTLGNKESDERNTKSVDEDAKATNVASNKVSKMSTVNKNVKDGNANSAKASKSVTDKNLEDGKKKVSKKSIVPKAKNNINIESDGKENDEINKNINVNAENGSVMKAKVNEKSKDTDINKNTEINVPKKVKKTDDIANIPVKKAKIDQATKNTENNTKITVNAKKSINNTNKLPKSVKKNDNANKNNAITKDIEKKDATYTNDAVKDSTYTKSRETIQKVTEMNKITPNKANLAERTDIPKNSVKNIEAIKNLITNPKKSTTIHNKVKNIEQNIKNNIQKPTNSLNTIQNKVKTVKNNTENNKNLNNGKLSQKMKLSAGNIKVKKLSAGNTVKETSAESKLSKIPQSLTKVANSLRKNPLRISPRKLSSNLKGGLTSVKKTIQKPTTSIPRFLKKPVVKT